MYTIANVNCKTVSLLGSGINTENETTNSTLPKFYSENRFNIAPFWNRIKDSACEPMCPGIANSTANRKDTVGAGLCLGFRTGNGNRTYSVT